MYIPGFLYPVFSDPVALDSVSAQPKLETAVGDEVLFFFPIDYFVFS